MCSSGKRWLLLTPNAVPAVSRKGDRGAQVEIRKHVCSICRAKRAPYGLHGCSEVRQLQTSAGRSPGPYALDSSTQTLSDASASMICARQRPLKRSTTTAYARQSQQSNTARSTSREVLHNTEQGRSTYIRLRDGLHGPSATQTYKKTVARAPPTVFRCCSFCTLCCSRLDPCRHETSVRQLCSCES